MAPGADALGACFCYGAALRFYLLKRFIIERVGTAEVVEVGNVGGAVVGSRLEDHFDETLIRQAVVYAGVNLDLIRGHFHGGLKWGGISGGEEFAVSGELNMWNSIYNCFLTSIVP